MRAYGSLRNDNREMNVRAWLYRVAHNRCIDHLRRPIPPAAEIFEVSRKPLQDPVEEAQRRDDLRQLVVDVGQLPEQQRSALLMREMDGMTYADLANALDVTVPAVKSLLVRARIGLVEAAEARDADCVEIQADLLRAYDRGVKASGRARKHMRSCDGCTSLPHRPARDAPLVRRAVADRRRPAGVRGQADRHRRLRCRGRRWRLGRRGRWRRRRHRHRVQGRRGRLHRRAGDRRRGRGQPPDSAAADEARAGEDREGARRAHGPGRRRRADRRQARRPPAGRGPPPSARPPPRRRRPSASTSRPPTPSAKQKVAAVGPDRRPRGDAAPGASDGRPAGRDRRRHRAGRGGRADRGPDRFARTRSDERSGAADARCPPPRRSPSSRPRRPSAGGGAEAPAPTDAPPPPARRGRDAERG